MNDVASVGAVMGSSSCQWQESVLESTQPHRHSQGSFLLGPARKKARLAQQSHRSRIIRTSLNSATHNASARVERRVGEDSSGAVRESRVWLACTRELGRDEVLDDMWDDGWTMEVLKERSKF